jgi:hypothetical protein
MNEGWRRENGAGDLHYRHRSQLITSTLETFGSFVAPFDRSRQTIFAGIFHRYRSLYLANRRTLKAIGNPTTTMCTPSPRSTS